MHSKIVRLFQYISFICSVNNNTFFTLKCVELCAKHKKGSEDLWESLKQPFQNVQKQPDTFKSKEIGFHMNLSREALKGSFACPKCCWNATKTSQFCIRLLLVMKNGSITTTPIAKYHMWNPANQPNQRQSRISRARR